MRKYLAGIGVVAALLFSAQGIGSATEPHGTVRVNPIHGSSVGRSVVVLGGAKAWLVFKLANASNQAPAGRAPVMTRAADGSVSALPSTRHDRRWSITGHVVTATRTTSTSRLVDWWDLSHGTNGTQRLGRRADYLGATPTGIAWIEGAHRVMTIDVTTSKRTVYSVKAARTNDGTVVRDGFPTRHGLAVHTTSGFRFVRYAVPSRSSRLRLPGNLDYPVWCTASDARYLACSRGYVDDDNNAPDRVMLVPLNGAKPTISRVCPGFPAVTGKTLVWAASFNHVTSGGCPVNHPTLDRLTAGSTTVSTSTTTVTPPTLFTESVATAYNLAVFTGPNRDTIVGVDAAGDATTLYRSPAAPVRVVAFGVSAGRLVDTDTFADQSHPDHTTPLRERLISSDGDTVTIGDPSILDPSSAASPTPTYGSGFAPHIATSGTTTAYIVADPTRGSDLRIVTPSGTRTVKHVEGSPLQVSGNRVFYRSEDPADQHYHLLDLNSGKNVDETVRYQVGADAYLWGNYLLYSQDPTEPQPGLHRVDLESGTDTVISALQSQDPEEYGQYIVIPEDDARITIDDLATNTTTTFKTKHAPYYDLPRATPAGVVYATATTWRLHPWTGSALNLVEESRVRRFDYPELYGKSLAWVGPDQNLRAAPVQAPIPAPQSLGDPIAPATFDATGPDTWNTSIPYSTALTSCSITIKSGSTTVRTLSCDPQQAGEGVAAVSWNGHDDADHPVGTGAYTWTVNASSASGAALDATGAAAAVTGQVLVS